LCGRKLAEGLQKLGLTVAQHDALAHLYAEDGISQQMLADRLLLSKGDISGLVQRLIEKGWVQRKTGKIDKRTKILYVTAAGKRIAKKALAAQSKQVEVMMESLSEGERKKLKGMMLRIEASLKEFTP
ncbi:MAG: MarR family transcriptional regulator, partial [Gammaproteobacteria bacterium]|nr:MarR family transcriptional regulator [Gammaproteobacteria bacterium]